MTDSSKKQQALLDRLQNASNSPRELALLRIGTLANSLESKDQEKGEDPNGSIVGTAEELVNILQCTLEGSPTVPELLNLLTIIQNITNADVTLIEELYFSEGFSAAISELIVLHKGHIDDKDSSTTTDSDVDAASIALLWESLREATLKIQAAMSKLLEESTNRSTPFTRSELENRLPLTFTIPQKKDNLQIMVHQVTEEEETDTHDTGFVMWPASLLLARHVAENPSLILDQVGEGSSSSQTGESSLDILELGAGCGLVGLTAAAVLQKHREESKEDDDDDNGEDHPNVILTDYCPKVQHNIERNLDLNGLSDSGKVTGLDFFDQPGNDDSKYAGSLPNWIDMDGNKRTQVGLILAADVICYSNDATNVANTISSALVPGGKAMVMAAGDNRRFGLQEFPGACRDVGLEVSVENIKADCNSFFSGEGTATHDLAQTSMQGYSAEDYNLTLYTMNKP
mmetsp:Transcript_38566/g.93278  ORF Transcript_38566/g.93278 Transcript_38566/m.93278 type:complete len:458 (+) Transcript_38566:111-1484(+)